MSRDGQRTVESAVGAPVIIFDGVCGLCNTWVDFVLARDRERTFRFTPLQSATGGRLLETAGLSPERRDSIVLVDEEGAWLRSTAALRILRRLGAPYALLYAMVLVPRPIRDAVYDFVAARRYAWFGRRETCRIPAPEERDRFL